MNSYFFFFFSSDRVAEPPIMASGRGDSQLQQQKVDYIFKIVLIGDSADFVIFKNKIKLGFDRFDSKNVLDFGLYYSI